jgi:hypothetical protein
MKSRARTFIQYYPNSKIVRVTNRLYPWSEANECWNNAQAHKQVFGSKMVAGWLVSDGAWSMQPNKPKLFGVRHFWNKFQGRYIDTTPFGHIHPEKGAYDHTYVLCKDYAEGVEWITPNTQHTQYVY